jgi:formiminoglutamase
MYLKPDMTRWHGRIDKLEGEHGRRWHQIVRPLERAAQRGGVALIGFACDAGVARNLGRAGARDGPSALRNMLCNMPVQDCASIVDAGDVVCENDRLESAQEQLADAVAGLLARGMLPIGMGGGHEIAYGSYGGLARHLAGGEHAPAIGVISLDAHFDLRMADQPTSGTPFLQIAEDCADRGWPFRFCCLGVSRFANTRSLFRRADSLGALWRLDEEMSIAHLDGTLEVLSRFLAQVEHVYLTICLDVLPAAVAPGVSAPAARGVPLEVIEPVVDAVAASGKLRLADIAELNPCFDIDRRTAAVAARLVARVAEHANDGHGS